MKKILIFTFLIFSSIFLYGQDCLDCSFQFTTDEEYCSELDVECGDTFTLTFQKCPIEDGSKFCSFCNDIDAFLKTYNSNISVVSSVDNGSSITYTFLANIVAGTDCYTGCISFWPCGIECEWLGMCYENSLAYHYRINVCGCEPDPVLCDDYTLWDCLSTSCECLKICVNNTEVIFNNTSGGEDFICFPDGSVITDVVDCEEELDCGGIIKDPKYLKVPETAVIAYNTIGDGMDIDLELPDSKESYELLISDSNGNTVKQESISDSRRTVSLRNVKSGIYFINIENSSTSIRHKVFLGS